MLRKKGSSKMNDWLEWLNEVKEAGIYCSKCGVIVDGEAAGFPRQCKECEE
jgi:hypothetical protein